MTDQSNPPKPPRTKSLIEMAGEKYDFAKLQPAPFPGGLPLPREPRRREAPVQAAPAPAPALAPAPVQEPVAVAAPVAVLAPRNEPVVALAPVGFGGAKHKVNRKALAEQGFIEPEGGVTTIFEEFRIIKRKLLLGARESLAGRAPANGQRVLVCSPHPGEGKSFCATNLALAMAAEKDTEVVLIDADFAKPSVAGLLGLPDGLPGLMDVLSNPALKVEDLVLPTDIAGLFVLPAGSRTSVDSEYLASTRTAEVLDRLTRDAPGRMVVFDSPPALAASPAAELAQHVGQVVLVARADVTGRSALEDAISLLSTEAELYLLLNGTRFSPSGRRFGAYYSQGETR